MHWATHWPLAIWHMGWFRHLTESEPNSLHDTTHCCLAVSHMHALSALHEPAVE